MLLKMILNVCCVMLFLSHLKTTKISKAVSESESVSETVRVKQKKDAKACRGGLSRCMISYCQRNMLCCSSLWVTAFSFASVFFL